jgi:hypothetical protein
VVNVGWLARRSGEDLDRAGDPVTSGSIGFDGLWPSDRWADGSERVDPMASCRNPGSTKTSRTPRVSL